MGGTDSQQWARVIRGAPVPTRERYERQARNNLAWGLEQLSFGRTTFRSAARF